MTITFSITDEVRGLTFGRFNNLLAAISSAISHAKQASGNLEYFVEFDSNDHYSVKVTDVVQNTTYKIHIRVRAEVHILKQFKFSGRPSRDGWYNVRGSSELNIAATRDLLKDEKNFKQPEWYHIVYMDATGKPVGYKPLSDVKAEARKVLEHARMGASVDKIELAKKFAMQEKLAESPHEAVAMYIVCKERDKLNVCVKRYV